MTEHSPRYHVRPRRCSLVRHGVACQRDAEYHLTINPDDEADFCEWCLGYIVGLAIQRPDFPINNLGETA